MEALLASTVHQIGSIWQLGCAFEPRMLRNEAGARLRGGQGGAAGFGGVMMDARFHKQEDRLVSQ